MRIACIHVPQFALQCATRLDPSRKGGAIAVVGGPEASAHRPTPGRPGSSVLHAPIVVACSRAAWALGVRLGMTATAARATSSEVAVVSVEPANERETVRAIAEAVLGLYQHSATEAGAGGASGGIVDVGGRVGPGGAHLAMYAEVPVKTRGTSFGERMLERLEALGLAGRVGIADDRFTAWVAAAHGGAVQRHAELASEPARDVTAVPRGGSAAFLAPRPLSLLAISNEVQHMLEALGVRTLGEFAALPAPSVARPLEADYQALARGESSALLRRYAPEAPIREEIVVSAGNVLEANGAVSGPTAIALLSRRIALRLTGRGRAAARLDVQVVTATEARDVPVVLEQPLAEPEELARVLAPTLDQATTAWRLRVTVIGEALAGEAAPEDLTGVVAGAVAVGSTRIAPATAREASALARQGAGPNDALAVVLSTPGTLFTLSSPDPRGERREVAHHRRTRRGKQRRTRPARTPAASAQSRLRLI
jgi:hypothetical protein